MDCLEQLEQISLRVDDQPRALEALDRIVAAGCGGDVECAKNLTWVAGEELAQGNSRKALSLYKRAFERTPEDDRIVEALAKLTAQLGLHAESATNYNRLALRHPTQDKWRKAAEAEHAEAVRDALKL